MKKILAAILFASLAVFIYLIMNGFSWGNDPDVLKVKYAYPESEFIDINGQEVHVRDTGNKSKPVLVLLHGVSSSLHTWDAFQTELSKQYRVISLDSPGFGITGPFPSDEYTLDAYMTFLDELLKKKKVKTATFIGNSFGGYLSWNYALHQPKKVNKLVLISSAGLSSEVEHKLKDVNIGFLLSSIPGSRQFSYYVTPDIFMDASVYHVYGDKTKVTPELITRYKELLLRKGNRYAFPKILELMRKDVNNTPELAQIKQKTLLLWGEKDLLHTPKEGRLFHEVLPNSKLLVYPELGHVPMEESPQRLLKDIIPFLLSR